MELCYLVDGVSISLHVVLCSVRVEVDRLHRPHDGVPEAEAVAHDHVQVVGSHHAGGNKAPTLVQESILHAV